ncbi:MAG: prolipoprotein diacylglyceryl transferase, partial [Oscillospiraceae bacterium]
GMGFLIGQAFGRWGNFFNQEAFGTNTSLPWGMLSPSTTAYLASQQAKLAVEGVMVNPALPVHPTFLYESLWCALGFLLLFLYRKKRKFNGELFLLYVMWYGFGRLFIEGLRTDSLMTPMLGLRVSQVLAGASVLAAFAIWLVARKKTAGKPLVVPEIPPHTATVKVEGESGPAAVLISWPADEKEPTRQQKQQMAQEVLKQQQEEAAAALAGQAEEAGESGPAATKAEEAPQQPAEKPVETPVETPEEEAAEEPEKK